MLQLETTDDDVAKEVFGACTNFIERGMAVPAALVEDDDTQLVVHKTEYRIVKTLN